MQRNTLNPSNTYNFQTDTGKQIIVIHRFGKWWMIKNCDTPEQGLRELYGQEFLRLVLGGDQPITMLNVYQQNQAVNYQIWSEYIEGGVPLNKIESSELAKQVKAGQLSGLMKIAVGALAVNEGDLSLDNILKLSDGHCIKVDGGWSFQRLAHLWGWVDPPVNIGYPLSDADIAQFPLISSYDPAFAWLDLIRLFKKDGEVTGKVRARSTALCTALNASLEGRNEMHATALRVLLLPDILLTAFIDSYINSSDISAPFSRELIEIKNSIKKMMLRNEAFQTYLLSDNAISEIASYKNYLQTFSRYGGAPLLSSCLHALELIDSQFSLLKLWVLESKPIPAAPHVLSSTAKVAASLVFDPVINIVTANPVKAEKASSSSSSTPMPATVAFRMTGRVG